MDSSPLREQLAEPLSTAVRQAFIDMVATEVSVRAVSQHSAPALHGALGVCLTLTSPLEGCMILSCGMQTATTLARRTLGDAAMELNPPLIADCLGEIANVVAGQAKALLAGTPHHFSFSTPRIVSGQDLQALGDFETLLIEFDSDVGAITLQLCKRPTSVAS